MIYLPLFLIYPISVYANNFFAWAGFAVWYLIWAAWCFRSARRFP